MRALILTFFVSCFLTQIVAQIEDDFSDGDFSNNPTWEGDLSHFVVNSELELQLNAPDAGNSTLFVPIQLADSAVWELYFNMDFAPSDANQLRIYLQSDGSDLLNSNGYFLEIGETGSEDALHFYRQDGTTNTLLTSGTLSALGSQPALARLRIERTATGNWTFLVDYDGGNNLEFEFEITDNTFLGGNVFFGFYCEYTASRTDKFFFDDISVKPLLPDAEAPNLTSVDVISETEIHVFFNENLDENSVENSNFSINKSIGNPSFSELDLSDKTKVILTLNNPLQSPENYTLTISDISDEIGNISGDQSLDFDFLKKEEAEPFDILINEIFADPTPEVGLPPFEFVELYNHSDKVIDLADYGFDNGGSPKLLSPYDFFPKTYLILCHINNVSEFESFGNILGVSGFPALVNSGDILNLTDPFGNVIHSVIYSEEMYDSPIKQDGGWSLELISPFNICENDGNWQASESLTGGTPGVQNSVFNNAPDTESPDLIRVFVDADRPDEIQLFFNENMDKTSVEDTENYAFSAGLNVINAFLNNADNQKVMVRTDKDLEPGIIYEITLKTDITDCLGNAVGISNSAQFGLPESAEEGDIAINEILFNPNIGGSDFVELYNSSSKIFSVSDLLVGNLSPDSDSLIIPINEAFLFLPQTYLVLTESPANINAEYSAQNPSVLLENNLPAFNADYGNVTLFYQNANDLTAIDAFDYDEDFHHPLLDEEKGVSLERINPLSETKDESNWHSAAESVGYATPTYQNSQFISNTETSESLISIPNKTFSPDNDGDRDFLQINYQTDAPDFVANVKIFDTSGRIIKDLISNELLATEGFFTWDGTSDENRLARFGIYIVYVQIFSPTGNVEEFKETCVLAERF